MFWLTSTESLKPDIYLYTYIKQRFVFFYQRNMDFVSRKQTWSVQDSPGGLPELWGYGVW